MASPDNRINDKCTHTHLACAPRGLSIAPLLVPANLRLKSIIRPAGVSGEGAQSGAIRLSQGTVQGDREREHQEHWLGI